MSGYMTNDQYHTFPLTSCIIHTKDLKQTRQSVLAQPCSSYSGRMFMIHGFHVLFHFIPCCSVLNAQNFSRMFMVISSASCSAKLWAIVGHRPFRSSWKCPCRSQTVGNRHHRSTNRMLAKWVQQLRHVLVEGWTNGLGDQGVRMPGLATHRNAGCCRNWGRIGCACMCCDVLR